MKTILVTGGTVFISRYIAEYYVEKNYDVYALIEIARGELYEKRNADCRNNRSGTSAHLGICCISYCTKK